MRTRSIFLAVFLALSLSWGFASSAHSAVDSTQCSVLSDSDSVENFGSLRRKVEYGFNGTGVFTDSLLRLCTDLIQFAGSGPLTVKMAKPLHFNYESDGDCTTSSPHCGDGIALLVDGSTNAGQVVIDTTEIVDD